ncbi:MAG TPA: DUF4870 domain-containing protein [Gemmatimonadaceae bacterium]|jgi:uncharacterized membrane protein|nr:DUF4870 domain-containing protein [Gemmatimonadaceae bacterium]
MTIPGDSSASGPTSTGLPANVAGALAYVLGPLTGIIFYILEKDNRFVRFHAAQSIVVSIAMFIISFVLGMLGVALAAVPFIGWLVAMLLSFGVSIVSFVLWIYLMWQALQGREWEAPFAGVFARRML